MAPLLTAPPARGLALLALVGLAACAGYPKPGAAPPPVSPAAATVAATRWPGTTAESLAAGRELFLAKCNTCHPMPDLGAVSDDEWPSVMNKMGNNAHLSPAETQSVLHFILAAHADAPAAAR